eukprot:SAG22_NODE_3385_length_1742_cov_1.671942_3_plen_183_part_00
MPDFLRRDEVAALNAAFDANWELRADCHQTVAYDEFGGMLEWEKPHCLPFRELLAHPKLIKYMNTLLGRGFHMDHQPFMICGDRNTAADKAAAGRAEMRGQELELADGTRRHGAGAGHGFSGPHFNGECYYRYANGEISCGMLVCQYQLTDVHEGDGGLGMVRSNGTVALRRPAESSVSGTL